MNHKPDRQTEKKIQELAQFLYESQYPVFFTGAGISTESGLPDFRGPDGVWTRRDKGLPPRSKAQIFNLSECGQPASEIGHSARSVGRTSRQYDKIALYALPANDRSGYRQKTLSVRRIIGVQCGGFRAILTGKRSGAVF